MFGINATISAHDVGVAGTLLPSVGSSSHRHYATIDSHDYCYDCCFTSHLPEKQSSVLVTKKKKRFLRDKIYIAFGIERTVRNGNKRRWSSVTDG